MNETEFLKRAMGGRLWFIHEPWLRAAAAASEFAADSRWAAPEPKAARMLNSSKGGGLVAVIPIQGVIEQRGGFFSYYFGGCSTEALTEQIRQAVNDPNVSAIVLDVDSPGGDVAGVDELASEIYQARKQKPITAVSNCLMASAAYYLASQANEVIVSPSSLTGSIGVYTTHQDVSEALANYGVKMTLISYGANKTGGNSYEPLSDEARAHMQEMVDTFGQAFEKAVGRGRGVKADDVHKKFGQGRAFTAQKAVKLGLADRVGTIDDALGKHGAARPTQTRGSSERMFSADEVVKIFSVPAAKVQAVLANDDPKNVDDDDDNEMDQEDGDSTCECACKACKAGNCGECACDACACDGCICDAATKARKKAQGDMRRKLELAGI